MRVHTNTHPPSGTHNGQVAGLPQLGLTNPGSRSQVVPILDKSKHTIRMFKDGSSEVIQSEKQKEKEEEK